jgi:hypothetical protein
MYHPISIIAALLAAANDASTTPSPLIGSVEAGSSINDCNDSSFNNACSGGSPGARLNMHVTAVLQPRYSTTEAPKKRTPKKKRPKYSSDSHNNTNSTGAATIMLPRYSL